MEMPVFKTLQWRHNVSNGVSNHQPHHCLLNRLSRRRPEKTAKLRIIGHLWGIHRWPANLPHKWTVTQKMLPFDDVIMGMLLPAQESVFVHFQSLRCYCQNNMKRSYFQWHFKVRINVYGITNIRPHEQGNKFLTFQKILTIAIDLFVDQIKWWFAIPFLSYDDQYKKE